MSVPPTDAPSTAAHRPRRKLPAGVFPDPYDPGQFRVDVTVGGKPIRKIIGRNPKLGEHYISHLREQHRLGRLLPGGRSASLEMVIKDYMRRNASRWKSRNDQERFAAFWVAVYGTRKVSAITPGDVEDAVAKLARDQAHSTVNHYLSFLRAALNQARRDQLIASNPLHVVTFLDEPAGRVRILMDDEEGKLQSMMSAADWPVVLFALETGARRGSQFALQWTDVNLEVGTVWFGKAKGDRPYHVPLTAGAHEALEAIRTKGRSEWVFSAAPDGSFAKQRPHNFISRKFEPALERAGILQFRWHDLRHTFASRLVMAGVPLKTVATYMGHTSTQMVDRRYAHLAPQHVDAAIRVLDARRSRVRTESANNGRKPTGTRRRRMAIYADPLRKPRTAKGFREPRQEGFEPPTHGLEGRCSIP
jgi:integrase